MKCSRLDRCVMKSQNLIKRIERRICKHIIIAIIWTLNLIKRIERKRSKPSLRKLKRNLIKRIESYNIK